MYSIQKVGGALSLLGSELRGKTADLGKVETRFLDNGSTFYDMDTSKTYMYDKENNTWILQKTGGGGSDYDGLVIYKWTAGTPYEKDTLVIKDDLMYICTVANADTEWDASHWSAINSTDGNYAIVDSVSDLPTFGVDDRKIYFVESESAFYFWNGTEWQTLTIAIESITIQEIDDLFV